MSVIDQAEIDKLLQDAQAFVAEPAPPPPKPAAAPRATPSDPRLQRIKRLQVALTVQLARRTLPISKIRGLAVGSIIEFEKAVEEPLEVLIRGQPIGQGVCVKIGENFGVRISSICGKRQRLETLARD